MKLQIKSFHELNTKELFEIYKLRVSVFVVEQKCYYQEVDDLDLQSYHVWLEENGKILAYARIFLEDGVAHIGRVISTQRRCGLGTKIVQACIESIQEKYEVDTIRLEAQVYARKLYEKIGFYQTSDVFLEDGIEHIQMELKL